MKAIKYWMMAVLTSVMLSATLVAQAEEVQAGSVYLDAFMAEVETFQAGFEQVVFDANGQEMETASGSVLLARPGKFRWDYLTPYPQLIVADGDKIWFYDVDLEQVTVKSQAETLLDTPASLLSGDAMPSDKYTITDIPSEDDFSWVQLTPKDEEAGFQTVMLVFGTEGLHQMVMKDNFDQTTKITFLETVENSELVKDAFAFTPPEGVDVVGDIN
jgi:outer membrane lipoprotein carrier protein